MLISSDPVRAFSEAVFNDLGAFIDPIPDGNLHRFDDPEGGPRNRACWYVLHLDGVPAGAFGNWRVGCQSTWRARADRPLSKEDRARWQAQVKQAREQREREKVQGQVIAARRAGVLWSEAMPATVAHPYIARKRISALGLRQTGETLLVPLRTIVGDLVNLQRIHPDGTKRFLKGGRTTGAFWLLGNQIPGTGKIYIAEGAATAATLASTLRAPVLAAMSGGNLEPVAKAFRERYPRLAIVVAADDDHRTPGNPGMTKAAEAARVVRGRLVKPKTCRGPQCACTDFNDTYLCAEAGR